MSRRLLLAKGETSLIACARGVLRTGRDEKSGGLLSAAVLAERVGWAADLVSGLVSDVLAAHWNITDVNVLASGQDPGGRKLPSNAWMALRRLGRAAAAPEGVQVNDRLVRIAQEQAGRTLRSAKWRADLTSGVLATWPADPSKRTPEEWDAIRAARRHQGVTTISTPTSGPRPGRPPYGRHRPRGAALGAGFHLHAHASPPRWETIPGTTSATGSFS